MMGMFSSDDIMNRISDPLLNDATPVPSHAFEEPNRAFNKMILIGDPDWVTGMIYRLHAVGIAEATAWSRLISTGNPGEVISTLLRRRSRS
jgi:hypothetical protein